MAKALVNLFALTLFVPKALVKNKPTAMIAAYRRSEQVRCHPTMVTVKETEGKEWGAIHTILEKDDKGKVLRDEKGNPTEKVETLPILASTRQAMIREWRQGALGLRG